MYLPCKEELRVQYHGPPALLLSVEDRITKGPSCHQLVPSGSLVCRPWPSLGGHQTEDVPEQGRGKGSWREQHYLTKTPENREGKHERGRPRRQGRQEAPPDKGGGQRLFTWHKAAGPRAGRAAPWCLCSPAGLALEGQVKQGTRSLPLSPSK